MSGVLYLAVSAATVFKLLFSVVLGFGIRRFLFFANESEKGLSFITLRVLLPSMLFGNLTADVSMSILGEYFWAVIMSLVPMVLGFGFSKFCCRAVSKEWRPLMVLGGTFQNGLVFPLSVVTNIRGVAWLDDARIARCQQYVFLYNLTCALGLWSMGSPMIRYYKQKFVHKQEEAAQEAYYKARDEVLRARQQRAAVFALETPGAHAADHSTRSLASVSQSAPASASARTPAAAFTLAVTPPTGPGTATVGGAEVLNAFASHFVVVPSSPAAATERVGFPSSPSSSIGGGGSKGASPSTSAQSPLVGLVSTGFREEEEGKGEEGGRAGAAVSGVSTTSTITATTGVAGASVDQRPVTALEPSSSASEFLNSYRPAKRSARPIAVEKFDKWKKGGKIEEEEEEGEEGETTRQEQQQQQKQKNTELSTGRQPGLGSSAEDNKASSTLRFYRPATDSSPAAASKSKHKHHESSPASKQNKSKKAQHKQKKKETRASEGMGLASTPEDIEKTFFSTAASPQNVAKALYHFDPDAHASRPGEGGEEAGGRANASTSHPGDDNDGDGGDAPRLPALADVTLRNRDRPMAFKMRRVWRFIVFAFQTPPVYITIIAIVISLTPPLRWCAETPVGAAFVSGVALVGTACVPVQLIVMGIVLAHKYTKEEEHNSYFYFTQHLIKKLNEQTKDFVLEKVLLLERDTHGDSPEQQQQQQQLQQQQQQSMVLMQSSGCISVEPVFSSAVLEAARHERRELDSIQNQFSETLQSIQKNYWDSVSSPTRFTVITIFLRLLLVPAISFLLVHVLLEVGLMPTDRTFVVSILIGISSPAAVNACLVCTMMDYHPREFSEMMFYMYALASFTSTLWLAVSISYASKFPDSFHPNSS